MKVLRRAVAEHTALEVIMLLEVWERKGENVMYLMQEGR